MAPSASSTSGAEVPFREACSAASTASPASPEKNRHLARRIWTIGSFGSSAAARSAQTIAASKRLRLNAVSDRSAQTSLRSGANARTCLQICSVDVTSPVSNARRAAIIAVSASRYDNARSTRGPVVDLKKKEEEGRTYGPTFETLWRIEPA